MRILFKAFSLVKDICWVLALTRSLGTSRRRIDVNGGNFLAAERNVEILKLENKKETQG
jgi:hypothetical protein